MKGSDITIIVSVVVFVFLILPVYYIYAGAGVVSGPAVSIYSIVDSTIIVNTLVIGVASGLLASALGFLYAWIIYRTNTPGRAVFETLPLLALTTPFLLKVIGWIFLLSPSIGFFNLTYDDIIGAQGAPLFNVYSLAGIILVTSLDLVPVAFLIAKPAIRTMDSSIEESSRTTGASTLGTLFRVTIPVLQPAILSSVILLTMVGMQFLEGPLLLAFTRVDTLSTKLWFWATEARPPRYDVAAQLGLINIGLTLLFFVAYLYKTRQANRFAVVTGKAGRQTIQRIGRWRWAGVAYCTALLLLVFVLPTMALLVASFITRGTFLKPSFGIRNYLDALNLPNFFNSIQNSLILGTTASIGTTFLSLFMVYAALKSKRRGSKLIEIVINVPLAVPGVVYSFALLLMFLFTPGLEALYGTMVPMIIAIIFIYLPVSARIVSSNLIQLSDELEESSAICGARWSTTLRRVTIPLLRGGMLSSITRAFLDGIRELGPVVLLATGSSLVIVYQLFSLLMSSSGLLSVIAAGSIIVTAIMAFLLVVLTAIEKLLGSPHTVGGAA